MATRSKSASAASKWELWRCHSPRSKYSSALYGSCSICSVIRSMLSCGSSCASPGGTQTSASQNINVDLTRVSNTDALLIFLVLFMARLLCDEHGMSFFCIELAATRNSRATSPPPAVKKSTCAGLQLSRDAGTFRRREGSASIRLQRIGLDER